MKIRPYTEDTDYRHLEKWIDHERVHALWCADLISHPITKEKLHAFLEENAEKWADRAYTATKEDGTAVGFFCYSINENEHSGFLKFIIIDHHLRGKGYGREMLQLALHDAFCITGAASVQLNVFEENIAAKKCYEKLGFIQKDILKNAFSYKNELWSRCHMVIQKQQFQTAELNKMQTI